jgi:hypothetical protein
MILGYRNRFFWLRLRHSTVWELVYRGYQVIVIIYLELLNKANIRIVNQAKLSRNQAYRYALPEFVVTDSNILSDRHIGTLCNDLSIASSEGVSVDG